MSEQDVIRMWKDEDYRLSLSAAELAVVPANPAGSVDTTALEQNDIPGPGTSWLMPCNSGDWMPCSLMVCPTFLWQCQTSGNTCPIFE